MVSLTVTERQLPEARRPTLTVGFNFKTNTHTHARKHVANTHAPDTKDYF